MDAVQEGTQSLSLGRRILFLAGSAEDEKSVQEMVSEVRTPVLLAKNPEDLVKLHQEWDGAAVLLGADNTHSDKLESLLKADFHARGTPVICLVRDPGSPEARDLLNHGATEVLPWQWLWRLPGLLAALREKARLQLGWRGQQILLDATKKLSLVRDLSEITAIVRRAARLLSGADGATFVLRDGDQCNYLDEDAIGPLWKGKRFPMEACISGWSMKHGKAAVISDIYQDPRIPADAYRPTFVKSLVMVPIRSAAPIGAIGAYWARHRGFDPEEVDLLGALADSASLAMENVEVYSQMERRVRDRTASLEASNQELEAFSYSVSHDLRSPLNIISINCKLLQDPDRLRPGEGERMLGDIRESAEKMTCLIEDLLRLAQVNRQEIAARPVDLSRIARGVLAELQASEPGRTVASEIEDGLMVDGDEGLLRIALDNLLSNAWKFTGKEAHARIEVKRIHEPDESLHFIVQDNGIGFSMQDSDRLFQPFQRLPSARLFRGTGVGLTTVQRIMDKHGGSVWAESSPGKGATFHVRLPLRDPLLKTFALSRTGAGPTP